MRFISFLIAPISLFALSSAAPILYDNDSLGYGEVSSQVNGLSGWSSPAPAQILVGRKNGHLRQFWRWLKAFFRRFKSVKAKGSNKGLKSIPWSPAMAKGSSKGPESIPGGLAMAKGSSKGLGGAPAIAKGSNQGLQRVGTSELVRMAKMLAKGTKPPSNPLSVDLEKMLRIGVRPPP